MAKLIKQRILKKRKPKARAFNKRVTAQIELPVIQEESI